MENRKGTDTKECILIIGRDQAASSSLALFFLDADYPAVTIDHTARLAQAGKGPRPGIVLVHVETNLESVALLIHSLLAVADIPIILLFEKSRAADLDLAREWGVETCMVQPFDLAGLKSCVEAALAKAGARASPRTLKFLKPEYLSQIEAALDEVGPFGEVHLIKKRGQLRFIQKLHSQSVN